MDRTIDRGLRRLQLVGATRGDVRLEILNRDGVAEQVPRRQTDEQTEIRVDLAERRRRVVGLRDLEVPLHGADDPRDLGDVRQREGRLEPRLQRLHEQLLATVAVDVGIEVPEADVRERVGAVESLVPGMEVDRGPARPERVVVAPIDVEVDAAQPVDDLLERVEVERDQEVDVDPAREVFHRVQRCGWAVCAAIGPRRVDPVVGRDGVPLAVDRDVEVAREREQRKRVVPRVGAEQHQRVGVRARVRGCPRARPMVVARDERDRRLVGAAERVEEFLRIRHLSRVRLDRVETLVGIEVEPAADAGTDHDDDEEKPAEAARERPRYRAPRRAGLVRLHRRRQQRRDGLDALPAAPRTASSNLLRSPHT